MTEKRVITVDGFEHNLIVNGMNGFRNDLIRDKQPIDDVDDLLIKIMDAPTSKDKKKAERAAR